MKSLCISIFIMFSQAFCMKAANNKLFGWFHLSPELSFGSSLLANSTMFDHDQVFAKVFNPAFSYGGQVGIAFMDAIDMSFELERSMQNQKYEIRLDGLRYDKNIRFNSIDKSVLLKYLGATGYFEIGLTKSVLNDVYVRNEVLSNTQSERPVFEDRLDYYGSEYKSILVGAGASLYQDGLFEINLGVRFKFRLDQIEGPELFVVDNVFDGPLNPNSHSRLMSFALNVQIHHFFGYFGKSICGSRSVIFFQKPKKLW